MRALRTLKIRVSAVVVCEELGIEEGVQELGRASAWAHTTDLQGIEV